MFSICVFFSFCMLDLFTVFSLCVCVFKMWKEMFKNRNAMNKKNLNHRSTDKMHKNWLAKNVMCHFNIRQLFEFFILFDLLLLEICVSISKFTLWVEVDFLALFVFLFCYSMRFYCCYYCSAVGQDFWLRKYLMPCGSFVSSVFASYVVCISCESVVYRYLVFEFRFYLFDSVPCISHFKMDTTSVCIRTLVKFPQIRNKAKTLSHQDLCSYAIGNMQWMQ